MGRFPSNMKYSSSSLPASLLIDGKATSSDLEVATTMNNFYVNKIDKLRAAMPPSMASDLLFKGGRPDVLNDFSFSYANASKIARVVRGMSIEQHCSPRQ